MLSPFAQQMISLESRNATVGHEHASFLISQVFGSVRLKMEWCSQACNYATPGNLTMGAYILVDAHAGTPKTRLNFTANEYEKSDPKIDHHGIITLAMMILSDQAFF